MKRLGSILLALVLMVSVVCIAPQEAKAMDFYGENYYKEIVYAEMINDPSKLVYHAPYERFDPAGATFEVEYEDGSRAIADSNAVVEAEWLSDGRVCMFIGNAVSAVEIITSYGEIVRWSTLEEVNTGYYVEMAYSDTQNTGVTDKYYIVTHDYEEGLNGQGKTLLAFFGRGTNGPAVDSVAFNSSGINTYADSTLDTYLNTTFLNRYSARIQDLIVPTTFYYTVGGGDNSLSTLTRKVFVPSITEIGADDDISPINTEGSLYSVLKDKVASTYSKTLTRSPLSGTSSVGYVIDETGRSWDATKEGSIDPLICLPSDTIVVWHANSTVSLADPYFSNIDVRSMPTKTTYTEGEYFSTYGLYVDWEYFGHRRKSARSGFTTSIGSTPLTTDITSVTVTYSETFNGEKMSFDVEVPITVNPKTYTPTAPAVEHADITYRGSGYTAGDEVTFDIIPETNWIVESVEATDANDADVPVTDHMDNSYSYIQPNSAVTLEVTMAEDLGGSSTSLGITSDKGAYDKGETVTFTITLDGSNLVTDGVRCFEFKVELPDGLNYVNSEIADEFASTTGWSMQDIGVIDENTVKFGATGLASNTFTGSTVPVMTLVCTVDNSVAYDTYLTARVTNSKVYDAQLDAVDSINGYTSILVEEPITYYTVTFKDWDGTTLDTQTIAEGEDAVAPSDPSRVGHTFTGWSSDFTDVNSDLTVTAQYSVNTYTVKYLYTNAAPVGAASAPDDAQYNYDSSVTVVSNPVAPAGWVFTGWFTEDVAVSDGSFSMPTKTVTFRGTWIQLGELTGNGGIDIADVSKVYQAVLTNTVTDFTAEEKIAADVNVDTVVDITDVSILLQAVSTEDYSELGNRN